MATLEDIFSMLNTQAQPRMDLGENQPVSTYMGRAVRPGMTLNDILATMPTQSPEEGSKMIPGLAVGAGTMSGKVFKPGPSKFFAAPPDAVPLSSINKMRPAFINEKTGEVMVNQGHLGGGGHEPLQKAIDAMKDRVHWKRGFADELTGLGFTDSQLVPGSYR